MAHVHVILLIFLGCPWEPQTKQTDVLISELKDADPKVRARAAKSLSQLGSGAKRAATALGDALRDADEDVRAYSADALRKLGRDATPAIPALVECMIRRDEVGSIHHACSVALVEIGRPAVPDLVAALKGSDALIGARVIHVLGAIGPEAVSAVPGLRHLLKADDFSLRLHVAEALTRIDPQDKSGVPVLLEALKDSRRWIRLGGAESLARLGPGEAKPAIPVLVSLLSEIMLEDKNDDNIDPVRVLFPLWRIASQAHEAKSVLVAILARDADAPREEAYVTLLAACLLRVDPRNENARSRLKSDLSVLVKLLSNQDIQLRLFAADTLGGLGADAKPAVAALEEAAKDRSSEVRNAAAEAVKRIQGQP